MSDLWWQAAAGDEMARRKHAEARLAAAEALLRRVKVVMEWANIAPENRAEIDAFLAAGGGSELPYHLRGDAKGAKCSDCGRTSWSESEWDRLCGMPQPDGTRCRGRIGWPVDVPRSGGVSDA